MANARAALARREIRKRQANGTFIGSAPAQYLNPKGAENKAFEFVNKYHSDTVNSGKARKNADGSITTVRARGVEYNGKIYTVPGYDRDTGRDLTEDQARERYMPQIQSGEIVGIPTAFDGPLEQHPANVGARLNHEWLDAAEVTDEQIGYDQGSAFDKYLEPAMVIGSSILAEPVSGMAGIVQSLNPFADEGAGARAVQDVQQAMTYQPRTEQGQSGMQAIGDSVVGDFGEIIQGAENKLGQWTLDATGSPVLATMAHSAPTALLEAIGLHSFGKAGREAAKANRGTLNMFAGPKAKTADLKKMAAAQELSKRGVSRDEIWKETGWYKGADEQWRFEIDDSQMRMNTQPEVLFDGKLGAIRDNLKHDELLKEYPEVGDTRFGVANMGASSGDFAADSDMIRIAPQVAIMDDLGGSTVLHEVQHAIQQREGFARGGTPDYFEARKQVRELLESQRDDFMDSVGYREWEFDLAANNPSKYDELLEQVRANDYSGKPFYDEFIKTVDDDVTKSFFPVRMERFEKEIADAAKDSYGSPTDQYRRLAGEAEARNVQTRMNMTPAERAAKPPWETLDVPESELIVRMEGGKAMSVRKEAIKELERRGKLDMSQSARMQRAVEQGYDVGDVWYHGSRNDITEFSNDKLGSGTGAKSARYGHFLTKDPAVASRFAGPDGAVYPVYTRGDNYIDAGALASRKDPRLIPRMGGSAPTRKGGAPVEQWDKDPHDIIFNEMKTNKGSLNSLSDKDARQYISERMSAGVSGFDIPDTWYDALLDHYSGYPQGHDVRVVFDPKDIRGVNADFDPANIGKNKLLGSADPRILPATGAAALAAEKLLREDEKK